MKNQMLQNQMTSQIAEMESVAIMKMREEEDQEDEADEEMMFIIWSTLRAH